MARCTDDGEVPPDLRPFAERVVLVLLHAGLSIYDIEAAADGTDHGAELIVLDQAEHGPALQIVWRQGQGNMRTPSWRPVQTTMHEALRAILTANGLRIVQGQASDTAPIVPADQEL